MAEGWRCRLIPPGEYIGVGFIMFKAGDDLFIVGMEHELMLDVERCREEEAAIMLRSSLRARSSR